MPDRFDISVNEEKFVFQRGIRAAKSLFVAYPSAPCRTYSSLNARSGDTLVMHICPNTFHGGCPNKPRWRWDLWGVTASEGAIAQGLLVVTSSMAFNVVDHFAGHLVVGADNKNVVCPDDHTRVASTDQRSIASAWPSTK